ncbi:hypothetical protein GBAR_LOCUS14600, partial [Geodia barretti]
MNRYPLRRSKKKSCRATAPRWASLSAGNAASCAGTTRRRGRKYPPSSRSGRAGWPNEKPGWRPRPASVSWRRNWHREKKRDKQQGDQLPPRDLATPTRPQGQVTACPCIGQRHAHPARRPRQRKPRPLERRLRTTRDAVRPAAGWETLLLRPCGALGRSDRPRNGRQQLRQRNRLAAQPGRRSRAFQPHGRPHAQVASQAAHQAMDRNDAPAGAGASR